MFFTNFHMKGGGKVEIDDNEMKVNGKTVDPKDVNSKKSSTSAVPKYLTRPPWTGNSQTVDKFPDKPKPASDKPISDYVNALDDKINQRIKEQTDKVKDIENAVKANIQNTKDLFLYLKNQRDCDLNNKLTIRLMQLTLIALIYSTVIAPILDGTISTGKGILGFFQQASLTLPGQKPQYSDVPSNINIEQVANVMKNKNHVIRTGPGELNIVYVFNPDFSSTINQWSDRRIIFTYISGKPKIIHDSPATIKGGKPSWLNPPNPKGYPVIVPGQYASWSVGYHKGKPALAQTKPIPVMRTKDQGKTWTPDRGLFGINQHRGNGETVRNWSEGCLVSQSGHDDFMKTIYSDPDYKKNRSYHFYTSIISASDLGQTQKAPTMQVPGGKYANEI